MRYFLVHLDDAPGMHWHESDPTEEIHVIPHGSRVATAVPVGALSRLLPALHTATTELATPTCATCGSKLPAPADEHPPIA